MGCLGRGFMPSAGALCQLLALGLLVETRLELAAQENYEQPQHDDTARRVLGSDGASFVTVAQVEAIVGEHVESSAAEMRGELGAVSRKAAQSLANATEYFGDRIERLERDVDSLRSSRGGARHRRTQAQAPQSCDPTAFQMRTDDRRSDGRLLPGGG